MKVTQDDSEKHESISSHVHLLSRDETNRLATSVNLTPEALTACLQLEGDRLCLTFQRFLLIKEIKCGTKGHVFLAIDCFNRFSPQLCILKQWRRGSLMDAFGRDGADRISNEARILGQLGGVISAPKTLASFYFNGSHYLATTYVERNRFAAMGKISWADTSSDAKLRCLCAYQQLLALVHSIHSLGIIHRDITHHNVREDASGRIALIDFELAYALSSNTPPFPGGTPGFTSPQQRAGLTPSSQDDIYSLGALFLSVITSINAKVLFLDHND